MYTIRQAATRAGVSVPLLRAWERRYGIVSPVRAPSGYRLYDDSAIERLRAMRRLIESGWSASQAALHIATDGIPVESAGTDAGTYLGGDPDAAPGGRELGAGLVDAAAQLDAPTIESILDDLFATGSFERVMDDRLMPALNALGDAWASGLVSVAGEHTASHAVIRRLSAAFQAAGRGAASERPVLVGLPPGSRHEIGALAFATAVRRRGIGSVYLGADVPVASWIDAARRSSARAIVIAIPTVSDAASAAEVAAAAIELDDLVVAVGGAGAAEAHLAPSVVRLPNGIAPSAEALEEALRSTR